MLSFEWSAGPPRPIKISKVSVQTSTVKVMVAPTNHSRSNMPSRARGRNTNGRMIPSMTATTMYHRCRFAHSGSSLLLMILKKRSAATNCQWKYYSYKYIQPSFLRLTFQSIRHSGQPQCKVAKPPRSTFKSHVWQISSACPIYDMAVIVAV